MRSLAPRPPITSASWEPRFAIEHYVGDALRNAIELWWLSDLGVRFVPDDPIRHVARSDSWLCIGHPAKRDPFPRELWEALPEPVEQRDLPAWIAAWLRTDAKYPERPWFDGGEARGFSVFWGHYGCEEIEDHGYGALVVLPKWFEIHK